jgi:hypothetical protein
LNVLDKLHVRAVHRLGRLSLQSVYPVEVPSLSLSAGDRTVLFFFCPHRRPTSPTWRPFSAKKGYVGCDSCACARLDSVSCWQPLCKVRYPSSRWTAPLVQDGLSRSLDFTRRMALERERAAFTQLQAQVWDVCALCDPPFSIRTDCVPSHVVACSCRDLMLFFSCEPWTRIVACNFHRYFYTFTVVRSLFVLCARRESRVWGWGKREGVSLAYPFLGRHVFALRAGV